MTGFALASRARALTTLRSIEWPIRRLGPYSCVLGFLLLGVVSLGLSRAMLIGWQWERVDVTDSLFSHAACTACAATSSRWACSPRRIVLLVAAVPRRQARELVGRAWPASG